jgi:YHYH protein
MFNYIFNTLFFMICLITNTVYAHGVHETNYEQSYAQRPINFLEFFISDLNAKSSMRVDERKGYRYIESDGLPDHNRGRFPNPNNPHTVSAQKYEFRMTLKPNKRRSATDIGHASFGVAINGVPFDPATAEYWNNDRSSKWNIDAINGGINLGLDQNNAHVQPNGAYHYHSIPVGLMERYDQYSKPVLLGYAADGFPLYGPYSYEDANDVSSKLINLFSSYRIKEGSRSGGPGGKYDGTYTADYEYVEGLGDLDQCNGRKGITEQYPEGTYYYVITDTYPFIPRCWMGKADKSFQKKPRNEQGSKEEKKKSERAAKKRSPRLGPPGRGIAQRDPMTACMGQRSGSFCSFRTIYNTVVNGTCRSAGADLVCKPIDR